MAFIYGNKKLQKVYRSSLATWAENNYIERCLNFWENSFVKCPKKKEITYKECLKSSNRYR